MIWMNLMNLFIQKVIIISKHFYQKQILYILNHIIHNANNNIYYENKFLVKRFPKIENFKNINLSYQPRNILLDLTKIIIKGNFTNFKFGSPHFIHNIKTKKLYILIIFIKIIKILILKLNKI